MIEKNDGSQNITVLSGKVSHVVRVVANVDVFAGSKTQTIHIFSTVRFSHWKSV
jgi:hypothetical protein